MQKTGRTEPPSLESLGGSHHSFQTTHCGRVDDHPRPGDCLSIVTSSRQTPRFVCAQKEGALFTSLSYVPDLRPPEVSSVDGQHKYNDNCGGLFSPSLTADIQAIHNHTNSSPVACRIHAFTAAAQSRDSTTTMVVAKRE